MPTEEMKRELESLGIKSGGIKPCPKCNRDVEVWGSAKFNLPNHPTAPLMLHFMSCGDPEEPRINPLPPVSQQIVNGADE